VRAGNRDRLIVPDLAGGDQPTVVLAADYEREAVIARVNAFANGTVRSKFAAYVEETSEVNWLVANHGG